MPPIPTSYSLIAAMILTLIARAGVAFAQCVPVGGIGPDIVIGDISSSVFNYSSVGNIEIVTFGFTQCNIGTAAVTCITALPQHPVTTQNLYKLTINGGQSRIEQIGQSWVFHEFFPLNGQLCCTDCVGGDGTHLGSHCANAHSATSIAAQNGLGPRWQINAANGVFPYPPANPNFTGGAARRLQINMSDLEPSTSSVRYFAEVLSIAPDEAAAGNGASNASWRQVQVSGAGTAWNFSISGPNAIAHPAIAAWQSVQPAVTLTNVDVPGDGRFVVASHASDLGNGQFRYEYAIYNLTSDRSCGSFTVPFSAASTFANMGFHDIDYRDGDGPGNVNFSGTDWPAQHAADSLVWTTESFATNASANAIRWGTLYNFRFDSSRPPMSGQVFLGLFKPGATDGTFAAAMVPSPCDADFNEDGSLDFFDYLDFVDTFSALQPEADFNRDSVVDFFDYLDFVDAFSRGC